MEDCLVIKLKGSVNKDLPIFNAISIKYQIDAGFDNRKFCFIWVNAGDTVRAVITSGNGYFHINGTDFGTDTVLVGIEESGEFKDKAYFDVVSNDGTPITIQFLNANEGKFRGLQFQGIVGKNNFADLDTMFYYLPQNSNIYFSSFNVNLTLSKIPENIESFRVSNIPNYSASITDVKYLPNIKEFAVESPGVIGDISQSNFTKCMATQFISSFNTRITGSWEDFAAAQVANGRTSGTLRCIRGGGDSTTVNGSTIAGYQEFTITFDSSLPNGYSINV